MLTVKLESKSDEIIVPSFIFVLSTVLLNNLAFVTLLSNIFEVITQLPCNLRAVIVLSNIFVVVTELPCNFLDRIFS